MCSELRWLGFYFRYFSAILGGEVAPIGAPGNDYDKSKKEADQR